jgi:hypothetical protein
MKDYQGESSLGLSVSAHSHSVFLSVLSEQSIVPLVRRAKQITGVRPFSP